MARPFDVVRFHFYLPGAVPPMFCVTQDGHVCLSYLACHKTSRPGHRTPHCMSRTGIQCNPREVGRAVRE